MRATTALPIVLLCALEANTCPATLASSTEQATTPADPDRTNELSRDERQAIEALYFEAQKLYGAGDLRGALALLNECYAKTRAVNLLFNIAQLYRELEDCTSAIRHYEDYLAALPNGERSEDARKYVAELRPRCAGRTDVVPEPTPPPPTPSPPTPSPPTPPPAAPQAAPNYWVPVGWAALGLGAVATIGAVYSAVETNRAKHDVEQMGATTAFRYSDYADRNDDFYRYRNWAFGLTATSVVATAVGVYALAFAAPRHNRRHAVIVSLEPNRASLDYYWRF